MKFDHYNIQVSDLALARLMHLDARPEGRVRGSGSTHHRAAGRRGLSGTRSTGGLPGAVLVASDVQAALRDQGAVPVGSTPERFRQFVLEEVAKSDRIVAEAAIQPE